MTTLWDRTGAKQNVSTLLERFLKRKAGKEHKRCTHISTPVVSAQNVLYNLNGRRKMLSPQIPWVTCFHGRYVGQKNMWTSSDKNENSERSSKLLLDVGSSAKCLICIIFYNPPNTPQQLRLEQHLTSTGHVARVRQDVKALHALPHLILISMWGKY